MPREWIAIGSAVWAQQEDRLIQALYDGGPGDTEATRFSHHPLPFAYMDWKDEVSREFGLDSLAQCNRQLVEDLPPFGAPGDTIPLNAELQARMQADPVQTTRLALAALTHAPERAQWSIIRGLADHRSPEMLAALEAVALRDPDATDRAFAVLALGDRWSPESQRVLRLCLFDGYHSVRLLAMELLGRHADVTGDGLILLPLQTQNPFQFLFVRRALERALPGQDPRQFLQSSPGQRAARLGDDHPGVKSFLEAARSDPNRPAAAIALFVLGSPAESEAALAVLERTLIEQAREPDTHHSPRFWLRGDIIQTLGGAAPDRGAALQRMLARQWEADPGERGFVLIALGYALERCPHPAAAADLARYRKLQTENYDIYVAGAMGLCGLRSKEAFPSLLHVLGLNKQPFFDVAMDGLERLTGVQTPGKPKDFGPLHNIGIPREPTDMDAARKFWEAWYATHGAGLKFDPETDRFITE